MSLFNALVQNMALNPRLQNLASRN